MASSRNDAADWAQRALTIWHSSRYHEQTGAPPEIVERYRKFARRSALQAANARLREHDSAL